MALTTTTQKRKPRGLAQGPSGLLPQQQRQTNAAGYQPGSSGYQGREDDVSKVAAGMMAKDSPLMQRAAAKGLMVANSRGLMNSSIAAGASMGSALDQVVPMASQTASQEAQKNMAGQKYQIDTDSAYRDEGITARADERQFGYQSDLSAQESGQRIEETGVEYGYRGELSAQEATQAQILSQQQSEQRIGETNAEYAQRKGLSAQEAAQLKSQTVLETDMQKGLNQQQAGIAQDQTKLEYAQRGTLSAQEYEQNLGLTKAEGAITRENAKFQSGLDQAENAQKFKFDQENLKLDGQIKANLEAQGFNYEKELTGIQQKFDASQAALDRNLENSKVYKQLNAESKRGAETMVNNAFNDYQGMIGDIMRNPDLSASERSAQIKAAQQTVDMRMGLIEDMHGIEFDWPKSFAASAGGTNGGGGTTESTSSKTTTATARKSSGNGGKETMRSVAGKAALTTTRPQARGDSSKKTPVATPQARSASKSKNERNYKSSSYKDSRY